MEAAGDADDVFESPLMRIPFSLLARIGSSLPSLIVGAAMEDRDGRRAAVRGKRLLLGADPLALSALVLRLKIGPSRLLGLKILDSFASVLTPVRRGVTLPSMNALDCERVPWVGVLGVKIPDSKLGDVYGLFLRMLCLLRAPLPLSLSRSTVDLTSSLAMFLTNTAPSFSANTSIALKSG